ncbi:MAG: FKBP-type peptidyl-prolyl cis-trans isomerase [Patescibacteria group bacterium]
MNQKIITYSMTFLVVFFSFYFLNEIFRKHEPEVEILNEEKMPEEKNTESESLEVEILKGGEGEQAQIGDTVSVHYTGTLTDGTKFDSSLDRGTPFSFTLGEGRVIQGWEQGVLGMTVGEKRKLTIPAHLGYGDLGSGELIPPGATLIFEVELLSIN